MRGVGLQSVSKRLLRTTAARTTVADLRSCWAKIHRARKHMHEYDATHNEFLDENSVAGWNLHYDSEAHVFVLYVDRVLEFPPEFGTLLGDVLQNLRAALDHLAWQLVLLK